MHLMATERVSGSVAISVDLVRVWAGPLTLQLTAGDAQSKFGHLPASITPLLFWIAALLKTHKSW